MKKIILIVLMLLVGVIIQTTNDSKIKTEKTHLTDRGGGVRGGMPLS